jgi:hypothetical protein
VDRPKLSDILRDGNAERLHRDWDDAQPAAEFAPMPRGDYVATIVKGELHTSKKGTPGYRLTFRVSEGEFSGRLFWHDLWLTPAALPFTKRDLLKLGVSEPGLLERPLPAGIKVKATLALRVEDDGTERNKVLMFEVTGIERDPFGVTADGTPQQ